MSIELFNDDCFKILEELKEKGVKIDMVLKALMKLFNQCPLQEYSMNEINLLSAFLIEHELAEEYIQWKRSSL